MKISKSQRNNIIFLVLIALLLIPQTRKPIQVFLNKGLALFSPSIVDQDKRKAISDFNWNLQNTNTLETYNFKNTEGKVVLVNFWATWCPPCIAELPSLDQLYQSYNDKVVFLFVSNEEISVVNKFLIMKGMSLPVFKPISNYPDYQFVIAGAPSQDYSFYKQFINVENVKFISNKTYDLLSVSTAALVTSGTATLETALFKVPQVVCYKGSWLSYQIGKRVVNLNFISLVNLIMDKEVVAELIQNDFNTKRLKKELNKILDDYERTKFFIAYYELEKKLGGKGASEKTAEIIYESINSIKD